MASLYEQDPTHWDKLAAAGKPHLREVAKYFSRPSDMDAAIGVVGAASHWHAGRNGAWFTSNAKAKYWLEHSSNGVTPGAAIPPDDVTPKAPDTRMLLIVATAEQAAKIEKIAAIMGAEVADV